MAALRFPDNQDGLIRLGKAIVEQAPKAGKSQGARIPSPLVAAIRKNVKIAEKDVALSRKLRRDAEQATARANKALAAMEKAARSAAQVLKELVPDMKDLGAYGFEVDETAAAAAPATPPVQ